MTREEMDKANASEQKKLSKYNNLYDRLRKKRDELQVLFAQRKFLNLVREQQYQPDYLLKTANLVVEVVTKDLDGVSAPQPTVIKSGQGALSIDKVLEPSLDGIEK